MKNAETRESLRKHAAEYQTIIAMTAYVVVLGLDARERRGGGIEGR